MAKINIKVPYIRCEKDTNGIGKDEIYLAVNVLAMRMKDNEIIISNAEKPISFFLSPIETKVFPSKFWTPFAQDLTVDIGNANALFVQFALYEQDDARLYAQMKEEHRMLSPDSFNWNAIIEKATEIVMGYIPTNPPEKPKEPLTLDMWLPVVFEVGKQVFKHFRQDDLLGADSFKAAMSQEEKFGPRNLLFTGQGARYHVAVEINKVQENA